MKDRKPRILLSAIYCSPLRGSESAVSWRIACGLAERFEVTVIYGDMWRDAKMLKDHQEWLRSHDYPSNLRFHHVQGSLRIQRMEAAQRKAGLWFLFYRAYALWQQQAFEEARRLHGENPFGLVHHLVSTGYHEPGRMMNLGIPFLWGPINGAVTVPWAFIPKFGPSGMYRHITRNLLNNFEKRYSRKCREAARSAVKLWAVTREDASMAGRFWGCEAEQMFETGTSPTNAARLGTWSRGRPLRLVWVGRIEAGKGLNLLLDALVDLPASPGWTLDVVGEGPERERSRHHASKLGISESITWRGHIPGDEVLSRMADADLLVHTSLKEGTPHVVLEALSVGLPVLCHDACGMGAAIDDSCGIKVPFANPTCSRAGFRDALVSLFSMPDEIQRLSAGALQRASELSWSSIVRRIGDAYEQVLEMRR